MPIGHQKTIDPIPERNATEQRAGGPGPLEPWQFHVPKPPNKLPHLGLSRQRGRATRTRNEKERKLGRNQPKPKSPSAIDYVSLYGR